MIHCPSCGAGLERPTPLERQRLCPHCGHRVHAVALDVSVAPTAGGNLRAPPWLAVGRGVRLHAEPFRVIGEARLVGRYRALTAYRLASLSAAPDGRANVRASRVEWDGERYRLLRMLPNASALTSGLLERDIGGTVIDDERRWLVIERGVMDIIERVGVVPLELDADGPVGRVDAVRPARHVIVEKIAGRPVIFDVVLLDANALTLDPMLDRRDNLDGLKRQAHPSAGSNERRTPVPPRSTPTDPSATTVAHTLDHSAVIYSCARCGGTLEGHFSGAIHIVCRSCGASTDMSGTTEDSTVADAARTFDHALARERTAFGIGSSFTLNGVNWQVIAVQTFAGSRAWHSRMQRSEVAGRYTLWWLLNDRREIAWIGEQAGVRFWSEPALPDVVELPSETSPTHEFGQWTLVDAAGEFPYRVTPGERHESIETGLHDDGLAIELFLNDDGEPWRIQYTAMRILDDLEVLAALDEPATIARIKRWRVGKRLGLGTAVLAIASMPLVYVNGVAATIVLPVAIAFTSIVLANLCEATATGIGHRTAFLTRAPERHATSGDADEAR